MNYMNVQFDECLKTFKDAKETFKNVFRRSKK